MEILQEAHYQILSTIFLMEFIELDVNSDTVTKNVSETCRINSFVTVSLNIQTLKVI